MLFKSIHLKNLLSFGPDSEPLELRPLNVLVGANGSGKSNLISAISILQAAPRDIGEPIREGGSIGEWNWNGLKDKPMSIEVLLENESGGTLSHAVSVVNKMDRALVAREQIRSIPRVKPKLKADSDYEVVFDRDGYRVRYRNGKNKLLETTGDKLKLDYFQSVLADRTPASVVDLIYDIKERYSAIKLYRNWEIGRANRIRETQKSDQRNEFVLEDYSNLALVISSILANGARPRFLKHLGDIYADITDVFIHAENGRIQLHVAEGKKTISANRLSDGTLRYLSLLAILCHPNPPRFACIEEPELGLHPDVIGKVGELLKEASKRMQLIVTTHSSVLLDALSETPEDVVVCEKWDGQTKMRRLVEAEVMPFLEESTLGQLWNSGQFGGNRW